MKQVVVLDYGSGNLRSAERALTRAGAVVSVTADPAAVARADGLVVPGVGAFAACVAGLAAVRGETLIRERLEQGRPVLGICVGMQILYDTGLEHGATTAGLGLVAGTVERLQAPVVPHMGWNTVEAPADSRLFRGIAHERFYFVHSYAATAAPGAVATYACHGQRFVAAIERGPLAATQFHPEKSGDAGAALLVNWLAGW